MTQTKDKPFCLENYKTEVIYDSDGDALFFFEGEKVKQALGELKRRCSPAYMLAWGDIVEVFGKSLIPKEAGDKLT